MNIYATNLRSVAAYERKQGRVELAQVIEGAANEIEKQAAIISALTKNKDEPPMSGREKSNSP